MSQRILELHYEKRTHALHIFYFHKGWSKMRRNDLITGFGTSRIIHWTNIIGFQVLRQKIGQILNIISWIFSNSCHLEWKQSLLCVKKLSFLSEITHVIQQPTASKSKVERKSLLLVQNRSFDLEDISQYTG